MALTRNVGGVDRILRLIAGPILFALGLWQRLHAGGGGWLMLIGAVLLVTGLIGFCGLYVPFGISSAPRRAPRGQHVA